MINLVGEEVNVKPLPQWRLNRESFKAKVTYVDVDTIVVAIDQWWVFFDRYGQQYGEYPNLASVPEFKLTFE